MLAMRRCAALFGLGLLLAGCGDPLNRLPADFRAALESPDKLEVMKTEGDPLFLEGLPTIGRYPILKTTTVSAGDWEEVRDWLRTEVLANEGTPAKCFNPHDAIRITKGGNVYVIHVCTHCGGTDLYVNGKRTGHLRTRTGGRSPETTLSFLKG